MSSAAILKPSDEHQYYSGGIYWNNFPEVSAHLNRLITGDPSRNWISHLASNYGRVGTVLSLNCGNGWVEREMFQSGLIRSVVGIDISEDLLKAAAEEARRIGMPARYISMDANAADLSGIGFDWAVNHAALHHVAYIDHLVREIFTNLPKDGLLVSYDYVGPHRNQYAWDAWSQMVQMWNAMPSSLRSNLSYAHLKTMLAVDPTEAVHSELIVPTIGRYFDVEEKFALGGSLAYQLLFENRGLFEGRSTPEGAAWVKRIIQEDEQYARGEVERSLFAFMICRPKKQIAGGEDKLDEWTREERFREHNAAKAGGRYYHKSALEIIYDEFDAQLKGHRSR